ncbi:hypothetical protein AAFN75_09930 [Algibacter sp. AS12]|uniref:hypothetical protein n=1 Tax=Algibacter sp. AS12 TaxID=3135773 RepID=UPI00398B954C
MSCNNDKEDLGSHVNNTHNVEINGEIQSIASKTPAFLSNLSSVEPGEEGYGLSISITLSDKTFVNFIFYNNDENAENVILGEYTTNFETAISNTECRYFYVSALNSNNELFISVDDIYNHNIELIKCDKTSKLTSGAYDVTLTNPQNNETMRLKGIFTNEPIIVSN